MSDLSVPGVTDKYNTQKIIDALMAVKKEPLTRMQKDLETEQQKKTVWQDVTRKLAGLRDIARTLYGFQNPFNDRVAASSDESALVAAATRQAREETKHIMVKQLAAADRFLSRSLPLDFTVDPGQYTFKVGDKEVSLSWKGGSLKAFAEALNTKGGSVLSASIVNDTTSSQVLLMEGKLTGSANRLTFQDKAVDLGVKSGMIARVGNGCPLRAVDQGPPRHGHVPLPREVLWSRTGPSSSTLRQELKIPAEPVDGAEQEHRHGALGEGREASRAADSRRHAAPGTVGTLDGRHRLQGHPHREQPVADPAARSGSLPSRPKISRT